MSPTNKGAKDRIRTYAAEHDLPYSEAARQLGMRGDGPLTRVTLPASYLNPLGRGPATFPVTGPHEGDHVIAITGVPGAGKTHLALHIAEQAAAAGYAVFYLEGYDRVGLPPEITASSEPDRWTYSGISALHGFYDLVVDHIVKQPTANRLIVLDGVDLTLDVSPDNLTGAERARRQDVFKAVYALQRGLTQGGTLGIITAAVGYEERSRSEALGRIDHGLNVHLGGGWHEDPLGAEITHLATRAGNFHPRTP